MDIENGLWQGAAVEWRVERRVSDAVSSVIKHTPIQQQQPLHNKEAEITHSSRVHQTRQQIIESTNRYWRYYLSIDFD